MLTQPCWVMPAARIDSSGGSRGMVMVETIGRVRHAFLVKGKGIKRIARELRLARNTVRSIVRDEETEHRYRRQDQPLPQLGAFAAALDTMLTSSAFASRASSSPLRRSSNSLAGTTRSRLCTRKATRRYSSGLRVASAPRTDIRGRTHTIPTLIDASTN